MIEVLRLNRQRMRHIVVETAAYYLVNPRSLETHKDYDPSCMYYGPNGERCAASRCMREDEDVRQCVASHEGGRVRDIIDDYGDEVFKSEYRGLDGDFWEAVQEIHDCDMYWNGPLAQLSRDAYVKEFLEDIDNGNYDGGEYID